MIGESLKMKTTSLFVEIVVIGLGGFTWVVLILFSIFGYDEAKLSLVNSLPTAITTLAFIYVLGIIIDRIADNLYQDIILNKIIKKSQIKTKKEYHKLRALVIDKHEQWAERIAYSRSRQRILRSWILNFILLIICGNIFIWTQLSKQQITTSIVMTLILFFLIVGSYFALYDLSKNEVEKLEFFSDELKQSITKNAD